MIRSLLVLMMLAAPASAQNAEYPQEHINALACTENLDVSTTWPQCLGLIFENCQTDEVGSEAHLACLQTIREGWAVTVENLQVEVKDVITDEANLELTELMGRWTGYVLQKCREVAATKPDADAAQRGCEITEIVGLAGELAACVEGRSSADYCKRKG